MCVCNLAASAHFVNICHVPLCFIGPRPTCILSAYCQHLSKHTTSTSASVLSADSQHLVSVLSAPQQAIVSILSAYCQHLGKHTVSTSATCTLSAHCQRVNEGHVPWYVNTGPRPYFVLSDPEDPHDKIEVINQTRSV